MTDRYSKNTFDRLPRFFREQSLLANSYEKNLLDAFDRSLAQDDVRLDQLESVRDISRVADSELRYKAYGYGAEIPTFFPETSHRRWLRQVLRFFKRKQDHAAIVDAVRVVLSRVIRIEAPYSSEATWEVGTDTVGETTLIGGGSLIIDGGANYQPPSADAFVVGEATIGSQSLVGEHGIDIKYPRTFFVFTSTLFVGDELASLIYLINLLKAAEEHYIIVQPALDECWVLADSTMGVDSSLCSDCWEVGVDLVGISTVICAPSLTAPDADTVTPAEFDLFAPSTTSPTVTPGLPCNVALLPPTTEASPVSPLGC